MPIVDVYASTYFKFCQFCTVICCKGQRIQFNIRDLFSTVIFVLTMSRLKPGICININDHNGCIDVNLYFKYR